eukprot:364500-Chlamydomonas_euryale.AAC.30
MSHLTGEILRPAVTAAGRWVSATGEHDVVACHIWSVACHRASSTRSSCIRASTNVSQHTSGRSQKRAIFGSFGAPALRRTPPAAPVGAPVA